MTDWIKCSERMPEVDPGGLSARVLAIVKHKGIVGYRTVDVLSWSVGGVWLHGHSVLPEGQYVTHWMPLPEPPSTKPGETNDG